MEPHTVNSGPRRVVDTVLENVQRKRGLLGTPCTQQSSIWSGNKEEERGPQDRLMNMYASVCMHEHASVHLCGRAGPLDLAVVNGGSLVQSGLGRR